MKNRSKEGLIFTHCKFCGDGIPYRGKGAYPEVCYVADCKKWYQIFTQYGLTPDQYRAEVSSRNNRCAICRTRSPGGKSKGFWHIDHDHLTGKFRGLLCVRCNAGIAMFRDSSNSLREAADYLDQFRLRNLDALQASIDELNRRVEEP